MSPYFTLLAAFVKLIAKSLIHLPTSICFSSSVNSYPGILAFDIEIVFNRDIINKMIISIIIIVFLIIFM